VLSYSRTRSITVTSGGARNHMGGHLLLGTMVAFLPQTLFDALPGSLQIFVGNSLITGIFLVLILEHLLLRNKKAPSIPPAQTRTP
jgi:hypothetical protein